MPSRKQWTDLVAAISGSFVSRNNDVDGYWALGLLRAQAGSMGASDLRLNLLRGTVSPHCEAGVRVARTYQHVLLHQLAVRRMAPERIAEATVVLSFRCEDRGMSSYTTYGEPFQCAVSLEDDRGRMHNRNIVARCAVHDPKTEIRSSRAT
jgi:hypothetical protein